LPWGEPKVIFTKTARSRAHWRISAFPDQQGICCYQTYIAAWPKSSEYDEVILAAILNSPLANAFVATHEGKTDITMETLRRIPVPRFDEPQRERLRLLVSRYQQALLPFSNTSDNAERLLKEIDALVLDGYFIPPMLERQLLDFFGGQGQERPVSHPFGDYFPEDCDVYFSLSDYLSPEFSAATTGALLKRISNR
jgi:hypothetical protein